MNPRLLLLVALAACGPARAPVTWHSKVEPLLEAKCNSCHREGGIAPFALGTREKAIEYAGAVKAATQARRMPPANVDASGSCQKFRDTPWLSDDELDVLADWADGDKPAGTRGPAIPVLPAAPINVTHLLDPGVDYTPSAAISDDYRCFLVDPSLTEDRFVVAFRVDPGDARIVHHVILFSPDSDNDARLAASLDESDTGPGYTCFGGPGMSARPVAAWAPGSPATRFPDQTGIRLGKQRKLVMQVHYNTRLGARPDRTRVALELKAEVPIEATIIGVADLGLELAPNQPKVTTRTELSLPVPIKVVVRGVFPHMHRLGRSLKLELNRAEKWQCALDVPRWSFDSQRFYFYEKPVSVLPGESLRLSCNYDTTSRTSAVRWGEGTEDEMCLVGLFVTPR